MQYILDDLDGACRQYSVGSVDVVMKVAFSSHTRIWEEDI